MICRYWRGWAADDRADQYERHYREDVLPELRRIPGFRGARLLRHSDGGVTEFVSLTEFDDMASVRAFAGPDPGAAVIAEEARRVLVRYESRVSHYEVAVGG